MKIQFEAISDISSFMSGIKYFDGRISMQQGYQTVNGRSLMGMYTLDLEEIIDVTIDTPNHDVETDFYNFLKKWEVKTHQ